MAAVTEAEDYFGQALTIFEETKDKRNVVLCQGHWGKLYRQTDPARAATLMAPRVAYEREIGQVKAAAHANEVEALTNGG